MATPRPNQRISARSAYHLRRRSLVRSAVLATLVLSLSVCTFTPAKHFVAALTGRVEGAYVVYRLLSERDALVATNQQLQDEVKSLRMAGLSGPAFEASVRAQIEELQGIVQSATALSLGGGGVTVARSKQGKKTQLAASIKGPRKASQSGKSVQKGEGGIGGSERLCLSERDGECAARVRKTKISMIFSDAPAAIHSRSAEESLNPPTIEDLKARISKLSAVLRAIPMGYPVEGDVTSGFGFRRSPFSNHGAFHEGMDISLHRGGEVFATGAGVVKAAGYHRHYGWMIDVKHSARVMTRYAHLSKTYVKVGERVHRGDLIALSGNTGRSTGPHLHYEVRVNGKPRDPQLFALLPQTLARAL